MLINRSTTYHKKLLTSIIIIAGFGFLTESCIDEFTPKLKDTAPLLVIDGSIIKGREVQKVVISKSTTISNPVFEPISECQVLVTDNLGQQFYFQETEAGIYESEIPDELLIIDRLYQLYVKTPNNKEYQSEFEPMLMSSPIDSIYFDVEYYQNSSEGHTKGLQFYADLKADETGTKNYLYKLEETWEVLTSYKIDGVWRRGDYHYPLYSPISDSIDLCWTTRDINSLYVTSTLNLSINEKKKIPLNYIGGTNPKLNSKYSVLVRQYALSNEAYLYHNLNSTAVEGTGGLYEAQPSQSVSNIKNSSDSDEVILGFFWASSFTERRIFFEGPLINVITDCSYIECFPEEECNLMAILNGMGKDIIYLTAVEFFDGYQDSVRVWGVSMNQLCIDCTSEGGSLVKPDFWE